MKLRNKKTEEIIDFEELNGYRLYDCGDKIILGKNTEEPVYGYTTLKEFNEDWEDYKPKESLIKDEKIRKAVKAWAEANDVKKVTIEKDFSTYAFYPTDTDRVSISVWTEPSLSNLSRGKIYDIAELCGEEKE